MDQFYTNEDIAIKYYNIFLTFININNYDIILEPSAGEGSFFKLLPIEKRLGFDIDPKYNGIIQKDFFEFNHDNSKKYIIIGNPPFGRISSTAIKFFKKASEFADVIAFIVPRTFKRVSVQNKLDEYFHLIYNDDLPLNPCCFTPKMSAKCCFQIWEKKNYKRELVNYDKIINDFEFLKYGKLDENDQPTPPQNADFVMKAYGCNCGDIKEDNLNLLRPKSWHWIKSNIDKTELIKRFKTLDFSISKDTVRQDSIGQKEVIYLYKQKFKN